MDPRLRSALDAGLHRVPGLDSLAKLLCVRLETARALVLRELAGDAPPVADAITADEIPSVAELGRGDRRLAEIDQDGFAFAIHPADVPFFNRRVEKFPRLRYHLDVVLHGGYVCIRKQFTHQPIDAAWSPRVWSLLGLFFYTEAAALLRLRNLPGVPRIRGVHPVTRTLFMDYVRGQTLQHRIAARGKKILDIDLAPLGKLFDPERDRHEIEAFASEGGEAYRRAVAALVRSMNECGVAPLDVKLGNVLVGDKTGSLYWLDFERASLDCFPRYTEHLEEHHRLVDEWFGLSFSTVRHL